MMNQVQSLPVIHCEPFSTRVDPWSPAERIPAGMLPLPTEFDRLLRVRVCNDDDEEHEKVVRVPSFKPAQPAQSRVPTAEDLRRLAPLELALSEAQAAQHLCFDPEQLFSAFAPLLKSIGDSHGIRAHWVDLSLDALNSMFENDWGADHAGLLELPEDLREIKAEVRDLTVEGKLCELNVYTHSFSSASQSFLTIFNICMSYAFINTNKQYIQPKFKVGSSYRAPFMHTLHIRTCIQAGLCAKCQSGWASLCISRLCASMDGEGLELQMLIFRDCRRRSGTWLC